MPPLRCTKRLSVRSPTAQTHGGESTQRRGRTQRQDVSSASEFNLQRQTNLRGPESANVMKKILGVLPQNNDQCFRNFFKSVTAEHETQKLCTVSALTKPVQTRRQNIELMQSDKCTANSAAEPVECLCSGVVCTNLKYLHIHLSQNFSLSVQINTAAKKVYFTNSPSFESVSKLQKATLQSHIQKFASLLNQIRNFQHGYVELSLRFNFFLLAGSFLSHGWILTPVLVLSCYLRLTVSLEGY